ncbi:NAD-dependent epimerase/dehydratase family protein [Yinghuangia sp. KLBMP8922]|uniref:NAD-dependent epimerase/dehydratase family protein n=1 Tax=Yinghuangia soli TaxID=2908204 RepID=A0AA41TZM5_9ACTN|nr:NAD-dependent epimerase/dehydratase family protein [Yinghuangia soli]
MALHVITGAGATGSATALLLAEAGEHVRIVTRSGGGPEHPLVERVAADASDPDALTALVEGARTLYNCAAPAYQDWRTAFPPLAAALLTAAERTGADYVMLGNVYGYGPFDGPLTPDLPMAPTTAKGRVRAAMWEDALAAHRAGRIRVAEVRASDYLGADALSLFTLMAAPAIRAGEVAVVPADPDVPHSWSYTGDVARTLVAVGTSTRPEVWGRAWHVPSVSELPLRGLADRLAAAAGAPPARVASMSDAELAALAAADDLMAEVAEMRYLGDEPLFLDASETVAAFGVRPTGLEVVLAEMARTPVHSPV